MKALFVGFFRLLGVACYVLGRAVGHAGSFVLGAALDRIYGKPQINGMSAPATSRRQVEVAHRGDFKPTVQLSHIEQPATPAAAQAVVASATLQVAADAAGSEPAYEVADRVRTAELVGPEGIVYGKMWLYLYTKKRRARRVLRIHDRHLARALGKERFYLAEVDFDPAEDYKLLFADMHAECKTLLNQRKPSHESRKKLKERQPIDTGAVAPKPIERAREAQVVAPPAAAPATAAMPMQVRRVNGDEYVGVVSAAGKTKRGEGQRQYTTFCLTIHDGTREVPLFGTELERQASDLGIGPGDKVRVVYMGREKVPGAAGNSYKNLYQLTRMETS